MKTMLIPGLLLAAASAYGVTSDRLTSATGLRMADYQNWFAPEFEVSSDAFYVGTPCPVLGLPLAFGDTNRSWSGWTPNWVPTALGNPIVGPPAVGILTKIEFVFLGETAGWWDNIGYRLNGVDTLLADGIQTVNPDANREFGDYFAMTLGPGDVLDFFVVGTEVKALNGVIDPDPGKGGKYFVFDESANDPLSASMQSYYGTLQPLSNARPVDPMRELSSQPFTVVAFEDTQSGADYDYNDLVFAFRAGSYQPTAPDAVPEPSTYGLIGALVLVVIAAVRSLRTARGSRRE